MKVLKKLMIAFCLLLLVGSLFTSSKVFAYSSDIIQPRMNIDQVLSTEKHLIVYTAGRANESVYDKTYRTITFPRGYRVSSIDKKDISSFGDKLGGNVRTQWTYNYTTY